MKALWSALAFSLLGSPALGEVERAWLSHRADDPSEIVVSWTTVAKHGS